MFSRILQPDRRFQLKQTCSVIGARLSFNVFVEVTAGLALPLWGNLMGDGLCVGRKDIIAFCVAFARCSVYSSGSMLYQASGRLF